MMAVAAMSAQYASAQTVEESKTFFDNWYIGINAGENFKTTHTKVFSNLNPSAGLRVGRYLTPVFGLAVEGEVYFNNKGSEQRPLGTFVKGLNVSLLGTTNLTNWFCGYKGTPRTVELSAIYGIGWGHVFSTKNADVFDRNALTSKLGVDIAFNLGSEKQWQLYLEPNITYGLNTSGNNKVQYNINSSAVGLLVGLNYKFGNSNGTHNFKIAQLRDQAEIDGLNAKINELRADNSNKDNQINRDNQTIANLKAQLAECQNKKPAPVMVEKEKTALQPTVVFGQGKSTIDAAQYANIAMVADYMKNHKDAKILIRGYASPEGSKEINQKLSEKRAEAVKTALVKKYKISASRLTTEGMGATDKLFDDVEFNRVVTFTDTTK